MAAHAVTRNTIKRVLRETFRLQRSNLPPGLYVFRLHGRVPDMSLRALRRLVRAEAGELLARVIRSGIRGRAEPVRGTRKPATSGSGPDGGGQSPA